MQINEVIIDQRFRDKIPPLSEEEFNRLRENILADGEVRDSLIVWQEKKILLDGHNRYRIIQENPDLPYTIKEKSFPDEWAATVWVCKNQLGRRNLNDLQYKKLIQEEHDARMKAWGGDRGNQYTVASVQNEHLADSEDKTPKTREIVAEEHNISQTAVRRAVDFGRALDKAEEIAPGIKNEVLSGEVKARASEIASLKNRSDEEIQEAVDALRAGERVPKKEVPYVQPVEEIAIGDAPYDEDDFREQISYFPKEFDDSIRLFLLAHGDMLKSAKCKAYFRVMLREAEEVIKKYKEVIKNEH